MKVFQIDWKKLVVMLLPTMLRKPLIVSFLRSATTPLQTLHNDFLRNRSDNLYRIRHTGQVCYLRAALNDAFADRSEIFVINDNPSVSEYVMAKNEVEFSTTEWLIVPSEPNALTIWSEDYIYIETAPFTVQVPPEIYADSDLMSRVRFIVNQYKLLSKQPNYQSL